MYAVSQDYLDKVFSGSIQRRITGYVDNIPFTEDDIAGSSFSYVEKCVNSADIKLGGVFIGELDLVFLPSFATLVQRGTWRGRTISVYIGLLIDPDEDTWVDVPLKPYTVEEANWSKKGVSITAYDAMYDFDRNFNTSTTTGTVYDLLSLACESCGVTLGMTQAQAAALPNGTETLGLYPENDIETWRDFISWIAVTVGGYATINRAGALELRTWHSTPDITIDINDRYTGGSWSDFETYYTGISIVNIEDETTEYISVDPDTGLTMNLGSNPLMQYGTNETKARQRLAVLTALQDFVYTPFSSSSLIDPILDLGDVVEYTNGLAGSSSICCVHKMEFKYSKGMKLTGFGKNPALFGARSKTDKNISGLLSKTDEKSLITHTFVNSAEIELAEDQLTSILKIRFATINAKVIKLLHEIQLDVDITDESGVGSCTAYYYLDNSLIQGYTPTTTWDNDGLHLMHLLYWVQNLEGGRQYTWEVRLKTEGCTATIDRDWVHALLEAQGLVAAEEWDGIIEVEDEYSLTKGGNKVFNYTDSVSFIWHDVEFANLSESFSLNKHGNKTFGTMSDSVDIETIKTLYNFVSEDKDYRVVSEDGNYSIESED